MAWNEGYVTDSEYTAGYHPSVNPQLAGLAMLAAGLQPPQIHTACELGFGHGLSINIHAAAQPQVHWWGADFMPSQVAEAKAMQQASGSACQLSDASFAEFCASPDLPEFDSIALHGVWSWVSAENRAILIDFFRRKLRVGGVVYVSYNAQPGWAPETPLRHLLSLHSDRLSPPAHNPNTKARDALAFVERIFAASPDYLAAAPRIAGFVDHLKQQPPAYVAHEFLNQNWKALWFSEAADMFAQAKLTYAGGGDFVEAATPLSAEQQAVLGGVEDVTVRETIHDLMVNRRFRKDYWVKGARRLSAQDREAALRAVKVVLVRTRAAASTLAPNPTRFGLQPQVFEQILNVLADYAPHSLAEIEAELRPSRVQLSAVFKAVTVLVGSNIIALARDGGAGRLPSTDGLNRMFIQKSIQGEDLQLLASPMTGSAVSVSRLHQIFLGSGLGGGEAPEAMAKFAWAAFLARGKGLIKNGQVLKTEEENLVEFTRLARLFHEVELPMMRAWGLL
jgi:SAM-dependent methyltransferase